MRFNALFTTPSSVALQPFNLLGEHARANRLHVISYCLMTNHVHIVAVPETEGAMANTFRHAHGRFSQYWNTEERRTGHVWQNRYYSCPVEELVLDRVIAYVENNPVRAGLVGPAEDFEWSSARAHLGASGVRRGFGSGVVGGSMDGGGMATGFLSQSVCSDGELTAIRNATYTGRPLGSREFVAGLEKKLGRRLEVRAVGRPKDNGDRKDQLSLWSGE